MTQTQERPVVKLTPLGWIQAIYNTGQTPSGDQRPIFNDGIDDLVRDVERIARSGNHRSVQATINLYKDSVPAFAALFENTSEKTKSKNEDTQENDPIMPPLEWGLLPEEMGQGISVWFDEYVAFSKKWSPRTTDIQHKGNALFILSAIARRRIAASYGGLQFTPLNIIQVAPSTVWGKTTGAKIAIETLTHAGLDYILGSNSTSPEKLLSNMSGKFVPKNWEQLTSDEQEFERKRIAHSGQLGWYYSEFGNLLKEMANDKGRNAAFKAILQRLDDGETYYENDTHTRGKERIESPYLALLGTMTPDCMKPYSGSDASSWGDGFYARFAFCCPPANVKKTRATLRSERFPSEDKIIPASLFKPLREWNDRLKERVCNVVPEQGEKGDVSFSIVRGDHPLTIYRLGAGVKDALDDYGEALDFIGQDPKWKQFQACYGRLRDKTLRIATLIASLVNSQMVELPHLAFAQHITEELRLSLHNLDMFLKQNNFASERHRHEDEIIQYLTTAKTYLTSRTMRKNKFKDETAETFDPILDSLEKSGDILSKRKGRTKFYTVPGEETRSPFDDVHARGEEETAL